MKCKSISTNNIDPYEAGLEIGKDLKVVEPEVVILFVSVHYADFSELYEGLYDGLETNNVIIFGGTGDGIYEAQRVDNIGACALGINSEKTITWHLCIEEDLLIDSYLAGQRCAAKVAKAAGDELKLSFVMAGMSVDGTELVNGIRSELETPCIGGLTGDDRQYEQGIVLANGKVYEDAVGILGCAGGLAFEMTIASGWKPIGEIADVEEAEGTCIKRVGGQTTAEFITQQFGKPPTEGDLGVVTLAAYQEKGSLTGAQRSPLSIEHDSGAITYFASIDEGTPVQVCFATRDDVISGVEEAINKIPELNFVPKAALVISCAGRKWILGDRTTEEVANLRRILPNDLPLIGLPTFGEIAPLRKSDGSYTGSYFHNVTYIVTLIG